MSDAVGGIFAGLFTFPIKVKASMIQPRKYAHNTSLIWVIALIFVFIVSFTLPRFDVRYLQWWGLIFLLVPPTILAVFDRRWSLLLIILLIFVGGGFSSLTPETRYLTWSNWLPSLGVAIFIITSLVHLMNGHIHLWRKVIFHPFLVWLTIFVVIIIVSAVYNRVSLSSLMFSFLIMLRYPLFFILLVSTGYSFNFYSSLFKWFVALAIIQIPILFAQYLETQRYSTRITAYGDAMVGTTGANYFVVFFFIVQLFLFAGWLLGVQRAWIVFPAILIMSLLAFLGEITIGYIIVLLMVYIFLSSPKMRRQIFSPKYLAIIILLIALFIIGVAILAAFIPAVFVGLVSLISLNWSVNVNSINFNSLGRLIILPFAFPSLAADPLRLIWGFGPESAYGGALGGIPGQVVRLMEAQGLSWNVIRTTSIFRGMMETGLVGVFSYWMVIFSIWQWVRGLKWENSDVNLKIGQLVFDSYGMTYVLLWPFYGDAWRLDMLASVFWLGAALVISGWRMHLEAEKQPN